MNFLVYGPIRRINKNCLRFLGTSLSRIFIQVDILFRDAYWIEKIFLRVC